MSYKFAYESMTPSLMGSDAVETNSLLHVLSDFAAIPGGKT